MSSANDKRLYSVDALRGFDMLLIIGLGSLLWNVGALHSGSSWGRELQAQMGHAAWEGLHAYDLIFPVFVYISGVCMKCGCYVEFRAAFKKNNCPNVKDRRW